MERQTKRRTGWKSYAALIAGTALIGAATVGVKTTKLVPGETGRVTSVVDGDTVFLDSGLKVRLSAMQSPKLPLGRPGFKQWPLAGEAKSALENLVLDRPVRLYYGGLQRDRYDRALAQVYLLDAKGNKNTWVQEEMIRQGWGRVYTWPDTWQDSDTLYSAERDARQNRAGIWGHDFYDVRSPDPNNLAQDMDSFQIIEGLIVSTADVRGRIYLNFGADYRTDFTVAIDQKHRKRFAKNGNPLLELEGARVRVRGWVEIDNGPIIWLDHPERLEVLN